MLTDLDQEGMLAENDLKITGHSFLHSTPILVQIRQSLGHHQNCKCLGKHAERSPMVERCISTPLFSTAKKRPFRSQWAVFPH